MAGKMNTHENEHINVEMYDECYSLAFEGFNSNKNKKYHCQHWLHAQIIKQDLSAANL